MCLRCSARLLDFAARPQIDPLTTNCSGGEYKYIVSIQVDFNQEFGSLSFDSTVHTSITFVGRHHSKSFTLFQRHRIKNTRKMTRNATPCQAPGHETPHVLLHRNGLLPVPTPSVKGVPVGYPTHPSPRLNLETDTDIMQMTGVRCPTCAANGQEVWVIPGRACAYCGTHC
jgi:hypothetical protein